MSSNAPSVAPDIQGLVAAEVERQVKALREEMDAKIAAVRERTVDDAATIVVFSGDLDKAAGRLRHRDRRRRRRPRDLDVLHLLGAVRAQEEGCFGRAEERPARRCSRMMTPASSESLPTSKMNYFGAGAVMLRKMMKDKQIATLEELIAIAREMDVKMIACTMSMDAMGVSKEELVDGLTYGGVATYMADAVRSRVTLFI